MDAEQALATLGLTEMAPPDVLRRAYMKQVRAHPPERDPDGFQRVRQAYELLSSGVWRLSPISVAEPIDVASSALLAAAEPVTVSLQAWEAAPAPDSAPAPSSAPANGSTEPESASANEDPRWLQLEQAFHERNPRRAAPLITELYRSADSLEQTVPPPLFTLDVVVALIEARAKEHAIDLFQAFEEYCRRIGVGAREISTDLAARWKIVGELVTVYKLIDPDVAVALAESTRTGRYYTAARALEDERTLSGPAFEQKLRTLAPALYAAAWSSVSRETPKPLGRGSSGIPWWRGAWLLLIAARFMTHACDDHDNSPARSALPELAVPPSIPYAAARPKPVSTVWEDPSLSGEASSKLSFEDRIDSAVRIGDCDSVRQYWDSYRAGLQGAAANDSLHASYLLRRSNALSMCSELTSELPPEPPP